MWPWEHCTRTSDFPRSVLEVCELLWWDGGKIVHFEGHFYHNAFKAVTQNIFKRTIWCLFTPWKKTLAPWASAQLKCRTYFFSIGSFCTNDPQTDIFLLLSYIFLQEIRNLSNSTGSQASPEIWTQQLIQVMSWSFTRLLGDLLTPPSFSLKYNPFICFVNSKRVEQGTGHVLDPINFPTFNWMIMYKEWLELMQELWAAGEMQMVWVWEIIFFLWSVEANKILRFENS